VPRAGAFLHQSLALPDDPKSVVTIFLVLLFLWALGLVTSYTMAGLIHVLLEIAIIVILVNVIRGRSQ
jgi:hypothetical protein